MQRRICFQCSTLEHFLNYYIATVLLEFNGPFAPKDFNELSPFSILEIASVVKGLLALAGHLLNA